MGIFRKKRLPRSEAAMAEAADLGPIGLDLNGHRLTFDHGDWTPVQSWPTKCRTSAITPYGMYEEMPQGEGAVEAELVQLRREKRKLTKDVEKFQAQKEEIKNLKERWNLLDFKYQLLLDMWTMRELDIKKDKEEKEREPKKTRH